MARKTKKKTGKRILIVLIAGFVLINIVAMFHAYKFTHFTDKQVTRTADPAKLGFGAKVKTLMFGVDNPRPVNRIKPKHAFETLMIKGDPEIQQGDKEIECWYIPRKDAKGTVIVYHGFSGYKSLMLDKLDPFLEMGYNVLMVDFMGSGGSAGNQTTIGYFEAEQVKRSFEYLEKKGEKKIFLFGTSMGAVSIMKAFEDFQIKPSGIIIECPFGDMYKTVAARFRMLNAPAFPMAGLLVFWGGIENGFWAFGHNPVVYAKSIDCPTMLMYRSKDPKVSKEETDEIFDNIKGKKLLKVYKNAGHEDLLAHDPAKWTADVRAFLIANQ